MQSKFYQMKFFIILFSALFLQGCNVSSQQKIKFDSEYQAVFLSNGQIFFGKLEDPMAPYPTLKNVFIVERRIHPETKQAVNIIVKRGNELHSPDVTYINSRHIVVIEPVLPNSRAAQLIAEAASQKPIEWGK